MDEQISPDAILQLGMGFWGSKTLLTAIELGLFSELAKGPHDARTLQPELRLGAWREGLLRRSGIPGDARTGG